MAHRLHDERGRVRAYVSVDGPGEVAWFTRDPDEHTKGVTTVTGCVADAKNAVVAAYVKHGWAPGGWTIEDRDR